MAKSVALRIAGEEGEPRQLRLDINALALIEDAAGCGFQRLLLVEGRSVSTIRLFIWAGLRQTLGVKSRSEWNVQKAGELIQEHIDAGGSLESLMQSINDALTAAGFAEKEVTDEPQTSGEGAAEGATGPTERAASMPGSTGQNG